MKFDIAILLFALTMLLLFAGVGISQHLMSAEAIAEDLAPQIGVDVPALTQPLAAILEKSRHWQIIVYCTPWAIISGLLFIKVVLCYRDK